MSKPLLSPPRGFDPVRPFVQMNYAAKFWFGLFIVQTITAVLAIVAFCAMRSVKSPLFCVIDNGGNPYSGRLVEFQQATNLHLQTASLATTALLDRSPAGFDHPELLTLLFLRTAVERAKEDFQSQAREHSARQIHQKAEEFSFEFFETSDQRVGVAVRGQLIRVGVFQGEPWQDSAPFLLRLKLIRNPQLTLNGLWPLAVLDFHYENTP